MNKRISDDRMKHMHGVAEYMYANAEKYGLNKDKMYLLGLLHDIGYISGEKIGHEFYGAQLLRNVGVEDTCILNAIEMHGMSPQRYTLIDLPVRLLLEADLMVGVSGHNAGKIIGFDKRLEDIGIRHGYDSISYINAQETIQYLRKDT